jgi:glycosyltransferase involved in cell wall biosynthesis
MSSTFIPVGRALFEHASMAPPARLKIVHVVRAPIGGIFRHIIDLADAQATAGHDVGIVCDSSTGGRFEHDIIAKAASQLSLGATRFPMRRSISLTDFAAARRVLGHLAGLSPNIIHCHGAKGGAYGRLIAGWLGWQRKIACIYAPHGGTLHFDEGSLEGKFYFGVERTLEHLTDALIHVSAYEAQTYRRKVGVPRCRAAVIRNGLREEEFVALGPRAGACDLLFLGMLRDLKGTDVLLEAIALLERTYSRKLTARLVGQAEEGERYRALAADLGIADRVSFCDPMPAHEAFASARVIVVPSRAESMPYVVLEAIAAGMPIIATRVGGIPEIFGPAANELVPPGDAASLALAIENLFAHPGRMAADAAARREWLRPRFHIETMQHQIGALYAECLARKLKAA